MATEYTVTLNELLKDTLPELPGVVRSVALREFRLTLRDFFEKTYAWIEDVKDVAVPTGETGIQVDDGDTNTEVIGVMAVAIGNAAGGYTPLTPLASRPVNEETTSTNPTHWYVTSNPDEFVLYRYLDTSTSDDLTVKVALMPALDIDPAEQELPRQVALKYYDVIMDGFLARMYAHPNKPYSAPMEAKAKQHSYLRGRSYYITERKSGYNGAPNWRFPRGWRVSRARGTTRVG